MAARPKTPEATTYRQKFAERLRIARLIVEPRQVDAAYRVGVAANVWYRYENGLREVDSWALATFCIQYDVCPRFLLLGEIDGLRPEIAANLHTIPGGEQYLPKRRVRGVAPASRRNTHHAA